MILNAYAEDSIKLLGKNSCDSVFLLDVIEHLDKENGKNLLDQCIDIAKKQIILFTPLGFCEQDCINEMKDGWGLKGMVYQQHRSGWGIDDFDSSWDLHIAKAFHHVNWKSEAVKPYDAFFAIKNQNKDRISMPSCVQELNSNIRDSYILK